MFTCDQNRHAQANAPPNRNRSTTGGQAPAGPHTTQARTPGTTEVFCLVSTMCAMDRDRLSFFLSLPQPTSAYDCTYTHAGVGEGVWLERVYLGAGSFSTLLFQKF